ncbi:hypothetical protein [Massilia pseudoviolaceinigra]|uniref:hypothetical protein n=1 Tax=Massilia pseudoviolaceinigra TaxID=3057165 RepID=UPI0027969A24|nr:hypothetical protein [Massilia sp. CCM 9206]MDQ1924577.1 hypothetical protein [Massilia sp. CCM 9206]
MIAVVECKQIDGKPAYRLEGWPAGTWQTSRSPFDAMIDLIGRTLNVQRTTIYTAIGVDASSATRCRQGHREIQDGWLLRMSDYSGIPVSELRRVAGIGPTIQPHPKARKA